jgi:hypothetical protein
MAPDSVRESILEFLNSVKPSRRARDTRCACGSTKTPQNTTFFYNGQSEGVILRVCPRCHPAKDIPTSDVPISYDA